MAKPGNGNTRRDFLRTCSVSIGAGLPGLEQQMDKLRALAGNGLVLPPTGRSALVGHRNLFNGDTGVFFYNPERWQPEDFAWRLATNPVTGKRNSAPTLEGGPFSPRAIHRFVGTLADNGVDTFIINANGSRAWYPSKTVPHILQGYQRGDRDFFRGHALGVLKDNPKGVEGYIDQLMAFMNLYQDLLDAGVDWLAETAQACRQRRLSPWVSIRMNDVHGTSNFEGSFFNTPLLKRADMRLSRSYYGSHRASNRAGLNYQQAEVRSLMFEQIREVVEAYDFEGLELDWWRQPLCCEPTASPQTVAMMSDWLRQIRALTQRRAGQTGRPYPLGLRIPGRLGMLKTIGLDVVSLCREGTLDFICPSGFVCTTWDMAHDQLRAQLGERVAIYGVIDAGVNMLPTRNQTSTLAQPMRYMPTSRPLMKGNAAGKLGLGADGIEWYNFYNPDQARLPGLQSEYGALQGIADLDKLRGQPKQYSLGIGGRMYNLTPFDLPAQLPVRLAFNDQHAFRVPMCAEPPDSTLEVCVQLVLNAADEVKILSVSFNECWPVLQSEREDKLLFAAGPLTHLSTDHAGYCFRFPITLVREGWNEIVVENGGQTSLTVVGLEVAIWAKKVRADNRSE
ncbi:hypothetical protein [Spirosoma validum]|uniref:Glycosyl hydrolase-like 10 domain-containing protein n=1 Tax=Spirosoma validum TaxID=2771355 RepID=A0A927B9B0_9BACT|nr:hypothetical protein [Spirosoma validum]MBD2757633.1 hypothetical protein [Spirosoma validum]